MKTAIILHGMASKEEYENSEHEAPSNLHWLPWIQQQLIVNGVLAQTPEMPAPYAPVYEDWKAAFERFEINENTTLIGHSCGAGFLVRWLSENKVQVGKVVLVAPWINPDKDPVTDMFNFAIDPALPARTKGVTVFISEDDDKEMLDTVAILEKEITGINVIRMQGKGHFTFGDTGSREFPELKDLLLS